MRYPVLISWMAFIFYNSAVAQNTISFKGQVLDNQYRPQTNFRLTVNNQNGVITDNAGIFLVHLLKGSTHLRIISAQDNYVILYPPGGYLAVPRDLKDVVPVIAGSEKDVPFVNEYLALHQLKNKERVETQDTLPVTRKMDSLKNLLIKLRFSEPTLQTLEKLRDDKDMSRSRISADLIDYINKAFEFKNAFKYSAPYAFNNASATEQLKKAVSSYNTIFNKLDTLRETYEKLLRENWRDDSITSSFHELMDFIMYTVHVQKIYPMEEIVNRISQYLYKKNNNSKKTMEDNISKNVNELETILPELQRRSYGVLMRLGE